MAFVALAFGWPTLGGQFILGDDQRFVTEHYLVRHPSWSHARELALAAEDDLRQPLPMLSFMLDAMRADDPESEAGLTARPFHATNVALHVLNAVLVYFVLRQLLCATTALASASLFAAHPFALEAVAWVSGRMVLLGATFALVAALLALRRRGPGTTCACASLLAWLCSLLSKAMPTVPIALALTDRWRRGRWSRGSMMLAASMLALAVLAGLEQWRLTRAAGFDAAGAEETSVGAGARLLLACGYYLSNYIVPVEQAAWHPPSGETESNVWHLARAGLGVAAALGLCVWGWRRDRRVTAGIAIFALLLAPFLAATLSRRMLAADRYMYLPIAGLHVALMALVMKCARAESRGTRAAAGAIAAVLVLGALFRSNQLAAGYFDSASAYRRVAEVYPENVLAHAELAKALNFTRRPEEALRVATDALRRWPEHPRLLAAAGEARLQMSGPAAAEPELRRAAILLPRHMGIQTRYASVLIALGRPDEAEAIYERVLRDVQPDHLPSLVGSGYARMNMGDEAGARQRFERVLALNPRHRDSLYQLGRMALAAGKLDEAQLRFRELLASYPEDAAARFHLGLALARQDRCEEALAEFAQLIEANRDDANLALSRAECLARLGRLEEAERILREYLARHPGHNAVRDALARLRALAEPDAASGAGRDSRD